MIDDKPELWSFKEAMDQHSDLLPDDIKKKAIQASGLENALHRCALLL